MVQFPSFVLKNLRKVISLSLTGSLIFLFLSAQSPASNQGIPSVPVAVQLQTGDLIWPKKPEAIVPYNSRPGEANNADAELWQKEKAAYLDKLRKIPKPTTEEKAQYSALQGMTYEDFTVRYLDDSAPGEPASFGAGGFYVGHVGVIQIVGGIPTVIEALTGKGVRRISYDDWLQERKGELVWIGRLKDLSPDKRAAVAEVASQQIGKPYAFWNFDLLDSSGFYCSKLAWFSIVKGAGFPPDDNPNPKRLLWYSPKRLMRSPHIDLIVNPGNYGKPN